MRTKSATFLALVAVTLSLAMWMVLPQRASSRSAWAAVTTMPTSTPSKTPAFAAMAYYDQNCARCHGPQGTFYGPTLGQKLTDDQLIKVINDMASGPGNAPLTAEQLPVETAFHRALIMRTPFVSVTTIGSDGKWAGEAMPDAKVTILVGDTKIEATRDDSSWSAQLPANFDSSDVEISATLNGVSTTLQIAENTYSNSTPIAKPAKRP